MNAGLSQKETVRILRDYDIMYISVIKNLDS